DLAARQRRFLALDHVPRVGQDHHHLAVDDKDAGRADRQQLDGVPLSAGLLVIGTLDDARAGAFARHGKFAAALLVDDVALAAGSLALDIDDGAGDAPVVAAVLLLDLALLRAHPVGAGGAVRADAVVQEPAVAHVVLAREPLLLAPLELELEVIVAVL